MKQKLKEFIKHPLIYGTSIAVIGNLAANFFNFLFNLFMGQNLSVAEFGSLATVLSLILFPALLISSIVPLIIRFAGEYFANNQFGRIRGLYLQAFKFLATSGIILLILLLVFTGQIQNFFHINNAIIFLITDFIIFLGFFHVINVALLQARLSFGFLVFINIAGAILKLTLGIILIFAGLGINGAGIAVLSSSILVYILSFIPLRFLFDKKHVTEVHLKASELAKYGAPSALTIMGLTSFISMDIILVKHFFDSHQAGLYAGLSLIGRVIFFISAPIGGVMFPLIVQKHSKNENFTNTFKLSLLMVLAPSILLIILYSLLPEVAINFFLKKQEYLVISPFLIQFSIFIALFSLLSILSNFYLSIKKTTVFIPVVIGALLQIIMIVLFHENFQQIIFISLGITFALDCLLIAYYPRAVKKSLPQ